jgi:DNA segregation ATPase FtsK/SpoIIIE-like protein
MDKKCECNNPLCAKCLGVNCDDDSCITHTKETKLRFRTKLFFQQAKEITIKKGYASPGLLQRELQVSYDLAANLMDKLESNSVIRPADGAKPRPILGTNDKQDIRL